MTLWARLKAALLPTGTGRGPVFWGWTGFLGDSSGGGLRLPGERDYANLIGDGSKTTIVGAVIGWIATQFSEPPPVITTEGPGGIRQIVLRHAAAELLRRPTWDPKLRRSWYSGGLLRAALVTSYWIDGNAYALKVRDRLMRVVQLWYVPHWMMEPVAGTGTSYIDHYNYRPLDATISLAPSEVLEVGQGIDPENPLKGRSRLKNAFHEIYTDEQAAWFSASILKNRGMPGVILAPRNDSKKVIEEIERQQLRAKFTSEFGGDNVGAVMVMGQPTELTSFGFSPEQLKLGDIRDIPEERVTALTLVPAAVVGLGTGLQSGKVGATLREYRELAAENNLIPTWHLFAEEYDGQVLPDFATDADLEMLQTAFDLRNVGALQDLELKKAEIAARWLSSGLAWVNESRVKVGLQPVEGGDTFRPQPGVQGDGPPVAARAADDDENAA